MEPRRKNLVVFLVVGLSVLGVLSYGLWPLDDRDETSSEPDDQEASRGGSDDDGDDDDEPFGGLLDGPGEVAGESRSEGRPDGEGDDRWGRARGGPLGGREGSRRRDPEARAQRRARFLRRIAISPRGDSPPTTTREELFEAFRTVRPVVRQCMEEQGVGREAWRELRNEAHTVSFELDAEGGVEEGSVNFDPPVSGAVGGCLAEGIEVLTTEPPGPDGAAVSIALPRRRGRDGGV